MRIKYHSIFLAFCCLLNVACVTGQVNYGHLIVVSGDVKIIDPVYDLQYHLSKATGQDFSIIKKDSAYSTGIQIIKLNPDYDTTYAKILPIKNADAVWIKSDGASSLKIVSYSVQGLINGIYTYLDTLGFRWFHPGDDWAIIPTLSDIRVKLDKVYEPDFSLRNFFGTFGTPRTWEIDKKHNVDYQWGLWATRNRLTSGLQGHAWTEFMWRHIPELKAHPEYMAMVNGKRVFPDSGKKFCVSNKGFQQLFIDDMVNLLKKRLKGSQGMCSVSVEPADGEGDCECDECKKFGSISNSVFYLANLVAKEFQKISPNAYVNLYAYNTHAMPPDFDLEPNVLVQIIPYGYQHYMSPEQMIEAWKKKNHDLYIYDYYGLPINNVDMPLRGGLTPAAFSKRLQYWYEQHIKGATLESSYSVGATGIGLYVFARMSWDIHSDVNQILSEYYGKCYGKAAPVIRQAEEILVCDTLDKNRALAETMHFLKKKTAKLKLTPAEQNRVTDYKAYLHYLKLLYDVKNGNPNLVTVLVDSLMEYTYGIFQTMMVHQLPITEYFMNNGGSAASFVKQYWDCDHTSAKGMKFASVVPITPVQIEQDFEADCKILK